MGGDRSSSPAPRSGRIGSIAIVVGISLLSGAMLFAAASGNPQLIAKIGPASTHDWTGFLLAAAQITGAGGLLGFGVVLSWMFGREFGDGTITGLFALPVRRSTVALAKLLVYAVWAIAVSLSLAALLVIVGLVAGLGALTEETWSAVARQAALTVMTAAIAAPVAWAATLGRSVLAGVSVSIGIVVVAQVSVLAGMGMDAARIPSPVGDLIRRGRDRRATARRHPLSRDLRTPHSTRMAKHATRSLTPRWFGIL